MTVIQSSCGHKATLYWHQTETHPPCEYRDSMPCEPCNELAEIEAQIDDLQSRLKDLHERHRQARESRNHIHSPLIHRFPPEISTYIFILALQAQDIVPCCTRLASDRPATSLILTNVCHKWRILALSTPRLWSDISVDADKPNFPLLNHQVAHSDMAPLSIHFVACRFLEQSDPNTVRQAIRWTFEQLHRTASFRLNLGRDFMTIFDSLSDLAYPRAAPFLQELHIYGWDTNNFRLAIESPRPQRVILAAKSYNRTFLDWANISSLTLISGSIELILPELLASQRLKRLVLWLQREDFPRQQSIVVNRSIEDLILKGVGSAEILTRTSMPCLQTLEIPVPMDMDEVCPIVCNFLYRSQCPLRVLKIHNCGSAENVIQGIIQILENTNTLRQLNLGIYETMPRFEPLVQRLSSRDRYFLPCLQTLCLQTEGVCPPIELLLDVMEAHSSETTNGPDAVRPLHTLVLKLYTDLDTIGPISRDDVLRILRLRAAGKTISISHRYGWSSELGDVVEYWRNKYSFYEEG